MSAPLSDGPTCLDCGRFMTWEDDCGGFCVACTEKLERAEVDRLTADLATARAEITELRAALREAADDIESWGAYASDYFQEKWDLAGDVTKYRALAGQAQEGEQG